ncbi:MAG TPA: undecaprenyl-diphosphate phosphatase [Solirubrobacteraceae bacterium]|nr:undecaprenyl-diphosphate phosphatase [Solirubrobacteraceae bacterium]
MRSETDGGATAAPVAARRERAPGAGHGPAEESRPALSRVQALSLGLLHGPAELLPISSSGHVALVPWLAGWEWEHAEAELRKAFEVALHAGTAAALLVALRDEVAQAIGALDASWARLLALSFLPAAAAGYVLERPIERRLGTPGTVAAGLVAGALAMALSDRAPQVKRAEQANAADALCLGLAQACALVPGVSRNGATLAAARMRGFARQDANRLSRHVALPVIAGASLLKAARLARRGLPEGVAGALGLGAAASFASTVACSWVIRQVERDRSLAPYAAYRIALALVVAGRLRRERGRRRAVVAAQ